MRLENAGIMCAKSSHYALMFHRCHARLDFSSPNNARLFKEAQDKRVTYIEEGLSINCAASTKALTTKSLLINNGYFFKNT